MRIASLAAICSAVVLCPSLFAQTALNVLPSRVIGQQSTEVKAISPNYVEGREFFAPQQLAVDKSQSPSPLYVADPGNNRVLAWKDANGWQTGAKADLVIGQLDLFYALPLGPGSSRTTGLYRPTGVAVDASGNLYVYDTGNNRILRYPKPFSTSSADDFRSPDMVIGQPNFTTKTGNTGGVASAHSLSVSDNGATILNSTLAFDANGNLWATDAGNNRVLRFPASALSSGRNNPDADVVLGQLDFFTTTGATADNAGRLDKTKLRVPAGLAVDSKNRVYVGDLNSRVLVFVPNGTSVYTNGQAASRILGLYIPPAGQQAPPANAYNINDPEGVFIANDAPVVVDRALGRVLRYGPYESWSAETPDQPSPVALNEVGQADFNSGQQNRGAATPGPNTLASPTAGVVAGNEILISDSGNNRVLAFPLANSNGPSATRVLGQDDFTSGSPNLTEGREFYAYAGLSGSFSDGAGITIDRSGSVPHLYVADTYNHRVLGFRDVRKVKAGDRADIVIGQVNFRQNLINSPNNSADQPSVTGLYLPADVAVDASGALYIADTGNGRVVRYPDPFGALDAGKTPVSDLILGQNSYISKQVDPTSRVMGRPFGLAFTVQGSLLVSDAQFNRVLYFARPAGGDFSSYQQATKVIGQADFFSPTRTDSATSKRLSTPRHIAVDSDDRLYVADAGNNRVVIYNRVSDPNEPNDPFPVFTINGLNAPHGITVSRTTGEIWVAEPTTSRAQRFPRFDRLSITSASDYAVAAERPLSLTQDALGMLYIIDAANRVAIYYTSAAPTNAASGNDTTLAPGVISSIYAIPGSTFGTNTASAGAPYPTELGDTQVLVNEVPAPLIYVSPGQINFIVPFAVSGGGNANYLVVQKSTGQVLGSGTIAMSPVAPALFASNGSGSGQIAALNEDNTVNGPSNPVAWGKVIQIFATGQGVVAGATDAGAAPSGAVATDEKPRVIIGTDFVPQENVQYSGLAPGLPGVWQINVKIPNNTVPSSQVDVVVQFKGRLSNIGKGGTRLRTTIAVKQQ